MREVVLVSSVRTPVGRAFKGMLRATRPDELGAVAIKGALERVPQIDAKEIDDVILGCAMPEAEQGMNVARIASLRAGLPVEVSALTINRFCSSGLQAIALAAERIGSGGAEVIVAGGTESMSMIPMGGHKISPNPWLVDHYPDAYLSMGLTAERLAQRFGITREQADEFSLSSHQKALAAIQAGKFEDETVPVPVTRSIGNGHVGADASSAQDGRGRPSLRDSWKLPRQEIIFKTDEGPRADTSLEALLSLKPAFHAKGTVTAGNSSQMSDGAAAAVVMSAERAQALGIKPLVRYVSFATAGYKPEEMGLGPVGWTEARRYRRHRTQRGFRCAVTSGDQRSRTRSRTREPQRRSDCVGTSAGLHGREADGDGYSRTQTSQRTLWSSHNVCGRRDGGGGSVRKPLTTGGAEEGRVYESGVRIRSSTWEHSRVDVSFLREFAHWGVDPGFALVCNGYFCKRPYGAARILYLMDDFGCGVVRDSRGASFISRFETQ